MGEEIDGIIQVTQETLGTLITKPKLTEKYLKKPPFRFLHDAVMEVTRATGFAQGLFSTEESDAGQLTDKQAKVDFLTKIISCTSFALGQEISVAPGKIVAGLEPERTNLFLQKLHEGATAGIGQSDQAVQRVLSGETVGATKEKKKKPKEDPPPSSSPPPPPEAPPGAPPPSGPEQQAAAEEEKRRKKEEEKRAKEEEKRRRAEEQQAQVAAEEKARKKEEEKRAKEEEKQRRRQEEQQAQLAAQQQAAAQQDAGAFGGGDAGVGQDPGMVQQPVGEAQGFRAEPEDIAARAQALMAQQGDGGGLAPQSTLERPRTAGRKPPKVTSKVVSKTDVAAAPVEAPTVIGDGDAGKDDDDDMFVVERPQVESIAVKADEGEHHGKLVREILEEKKKEEEKEREDVAASRGAATAEKVEDGQETGGGIKMGKLKRKKDQAQQYANIDVLKLRENIQQLCQAANPLGKSIDLVHQDIANMGKELDHWRQETRNAVESYHQERKVTEETLMPLHRRMAELDESIAEMNSKVQNSRARILKNDVQIQNLLESVMASK